MSVTFDKERKMKNVHVILSTMQVHQYAENKSKGAREEGHERERLRWISNTTILIRRLGAGWDSKFLQTGQSFGVGLVSVVKHDDRLVVQRNVSSNAVTGVVPSALINVYLSIPLEARVAAD